MLRRIAMVLLLSLTWTAQARAEKIGALTTVFGAESIHIEGLGIVTGLRGTGDREAAVVKLMRDYLEKNEIALELDDLSSRNIAFVKVSAWIPPFSRPGQKLELRVSAINDATSLEGGLLMQCDLRPRPGGPVYAVAMGRVLVGLPELHSTTGIIPANQNGGGQIIAMIPTQVVEDDDKFRLNLNRANFADAAAIAQAINSSDTLNPNRQLQIGFGGQAEIEKIAWALDPVQVIVQIPGGKRDQKVEFIAEVLNTDVPVDRPPRVLFNRQTRTVVLTGNIQVDPVTVSHNNRFVTLTQPAAAGVGGPQRQEYELLPNEERRLIELQGYRRSMPNLQEMIDTLNAMGTTTEDIITILQKLKAAGALHAELVVE